MPPMFEQAMKNGVMAPWWSNPTEKQAENQCRSAKRFKSEFLSFV